MRIEFGRAAGDVNNWNIGLRQPIEYSRHRLACHHFAASRPGVDVAMDTGLIALFADVDL